MEKLVNIIESTPVLGIAFLSENEMQSIRGGIPPLKPKSRPREIYDDEIE